MNYHVRVKEARLRATQQSLNGAVLELLSGVQVCARFQLERISAVVLADMLVFTGFPMFGRAEVGGKITAGRIVHREDGAELVQDMSVGLTDSNADVRLEKLTADAGNLIRLDHAEIRHA